MYNNCIINTNFNAGIYIRLSQEDQDKKYESDSESVVNQRELLKDYVRNNGFNLIDEYVDDGYTGTNFDRPGFKKLLQDINDKKINLVIVKDLSRLGRDHVMTGYYIETYFPENNIRFISILESIDTFKSQATNDTSTFLIAFNDYYSKQNSIKIRNVLNSKRQNGKFIGSAPSFGYMRDPEDKGHLIPDSKTAPIVKHIFKWRANGMGISEITTKLNEMKYPTPSGYKNTKYSSRLIKRDEWNISSVKKILCNRIYTGDMVQRTQTKVNYKSKKKITLDKSMWIIVENTHEPLIDKTTFDYIQTLKKRPNVSCHSHIEREKRLFEGLLYCKECKNRLSVLYRSNLDYWSINCNRYSRDPKRKRCYPHFYPYNYLEQQLLNEFNKIVATHLNNLDFNELNKEVAKKVNAETLDYKNNIKELKKSKDKIVKRIESLYNDKFEGIISLSSYQAMTKSLEEKLSLIDISIEEQNSKIKEVNKNMEFIPDYYKQIKQLLDLNKAKKELLQTLIDRIEIDKDRYITFKFKYGIIEDYTFKYKESNKPRNPYGKKGKTNKI